MTIEASDKNTQSPNTFPQTRRTRRLIAAVAATAIAVGGGAVLLKEKQSPDHEGDSHSLANTPSPNKTPRPTAEATETAILRVPKIVETLPGYGNKVSEQEQAKLRASTVKIALRPKDNPGAEWNAVCTGIKANIDGKDVIVTARHCFDNSLDMKTEFPSLDIAAADPATAPDLHQAKNVTDSMGDDVGIWTIGADGKPDKTQTAFASGISLSFYPDMAVLGIDEEDSASSAINAMPAVDYQAAMKNTAIPGSEATIFGLPDSSGGSVVKNTGWYLGRIHDPGDPAREIDLVAINPSSPAENACNEGSSGLSTVIAPDVMTATLTGHNPDRKLTAFHLGVHPQDLQDIDTICAFSVATPSEVSALAQ